MAARTTPASTMTGPATAQKVTPDITLPPRTPTPCSVKTTPASVRTNPLPTSTTRLMVLPHTSRAAGRGPPPCRYPWNGAAGTGVQRDLAVVLGGPRPGARPEFLRQVRGGGPAA